MNRLENLRCILIFKHCYWCTEDPGSFFFCLLQLLKYLVCKGPKQEGWKYYLHIYFHLACGLCVSVWAVCSPSQAQILLRFGSAVWTLSRISSLHIYCPQIGDTHLPVHTTPPPKGSVIGVVDHTCQLHLHIQVCFNCSH